MWKTNRIKLIAIVMATLMLPWHVFLFKEKNIEPFGRVTSYTYDDADQLTKVEDEFGNYVITTYDCMGRVMNETDSTRSVAEYEYDRMGNLIHSTYTAASGNASNSSSQTQVAPAGGSAADELAETETVTENKAKEYSYTYDQLGRLLTVTDPKKSATSQTFDVLGQVRSVTDANGGTTEYTYDNSGNIISETNAIGVTKTYEYDPFDNLIKSTDGRGNVTTYQYDLCGRLVSFTDGVGTVIFEYDKNGNVVTISEREKKMDSEENDITETSEEKTITRKYDNMNRVTEVTDVNGKTIKYSYDELGNILTIEYPGGEIVRYTYNPDSSLESFVDGAGRKTSYTYDRQGRKERVTRPDGSVETTTYNEQSRIESVTDCASDGTLLQKYEYTYDGWGNITSIKEAVKPDYEINHTPEGFGVGAEVSDGTENEDTETTIISNMEYNAANQLIKFNGKDVEYDADGNMTYGPLSGEMTAFTYDCRNRLISAGGETYTYDAENVLVSVETEDYVETYLTDRVYPLSRTLVIERTPKPKESALNENQNNKSLITTCYYGEGLVYDVTISESDNQNATNNNNSASDSTNQTSVNSNATGQPELRIYHFDHLGSTSYLTDENSNITLYFDYGTYGEFLGCHNADYSECDFSMLENPVRYLYNGELGVLTNDNSLLYMRQRFYNPEIKRFINQDVLTGTISNSLSLNRYSYVEGNPINYSDPFGLSKVRDTLKGLHSTYNVIKKSITHMSLHTTLDLLGTIPGIGSLFDVANAGLFALEGKYKEAATRMLFAVPTMNLLGAGEKVAEFFGTSGKYLLPVLKGVKISANVAVVSICAVPTISNAKDLYTDYIKNGKDLDVEGLQRTFSVLAGYQMTTAYSKNLFRELGTTVGIEETVQYVRGTSEPIDSGPEWEPPPERRQTDFYSGPKGTARSLDEYEGYMGDEEWGKPKQIHHFATNKNKTYTPQFEEIANKYGLNLDDDWNKKYMPHQGRHPNEYHEYVLERMGQIDIIAQGDRQIFLKLYDNMKKDISNKPEMLYKNYWRKGE